LGRNFRDIERRDKRTKNVLCHQLKWLCLENDWVTLILMQVFFKKNTTSKHSYF
jgi:hypothetical protein